MRAGFVAGLNEVFLIGALLALVAAVLTLVLIRSRDFETSAARSSARPTGAVQSEADQRDAAVSEAGMRPELDRERERLVRELREHIEAAEHHVEEATATRARLHRLGDDIDRDALDTTPGANGRAGRSRE